MQPHIVLAEDDPGQRFGLMRALVRHIPDARVTSAPHGAAALDAILETGADVLITDQQMPILTGLDLIRALRDRGLDLPILMLSSDADSAAAAIAAGAVDFVLFRNWIPVRSPAR